MIGTRKRAVPAFDMISQCKSMPHPVALDLALHYSVVVVLIPCLQELLILSVFRIRPIDQAHQLEQGAIHH